MCTIGCISTVNRSGDPIVYMLKNLDLIQTPFAHARFSNPSGYDFAGVVCTRQPGINSGLNERGLGMVISYSDYRPHYRPTDYGQPPLCTVDDLRTMANAVVLSECATVDEAIAFYQQFVPRHPEMPGGNQMLADARGNIAVVEHCEGELRFEIKRGRGFLARGNHSHLLIAERQASSNPAGYADSRQRDAAMEAALQRWDTELGNGLTEQEFLAQAKAFLSTHGTPDPNGQAAICRHERVVASTGLVVSTLCSLVFHVTAAHMYFTLGKPCQSDWQRLEVTALPIS